MGLRPRSLLFFLGLFSLALLSTVSSANPSEGDDVGAVAQDGPGALQNDSELTSRFLASSDDSSVASTSSASRTETIPNGPACPRCALADLPLTKSTSATRLVPPLKPELSKQPGAFIENRGQFPERVKFQLRGGGTSLWVTEYGIVFDSLRAKAGAVDPKKARDSKSGQATLLGIESQGRIPDPKSFERLSFSEEFVGASGASNIAASGCQAVVYNYLFGKDRKKWVTHVSSHSEVIYQDLWPGIDLRLYRHGADLEQEFALKPGADLTTVQIAYKGIKGLEVADDGALVVKTAFGDLWESRPRIYQEIAGNRVPIEGRFRLTGESTYTFDVPSYQPQYALVVDPTLLYSTYLGGTGTFGLCNPSEEGTAIAVDSSGDAYVTGWTSASNFPTTSGSIQTEYSGGSIVAFVTKLNPLGSGLVYSTYLGGSGSAGFGIAVDSADEAYVVGGTGSSFPTTANAFQASCSETAFFSKLDAAGDSLLYSTCFGSSIAVSAAGGVRVAVAIGPTGTAYLAGTTGSGLPTTPGAYQTAYPGGGSSAFLAVFDPSASGSSSLVYSSYLGGSNKFAPTDGVGVAVDSFGGAYVTGYTGDGFPTTPDAYQPTHAGTGCVGTPSVDANCIDAFVAKFNIQAAGTASLIYSTYLGGSQSDYGQGIAVDNQGNAYVSGPTFSCDFPVTKGAFQTSFSGCGGTQSVVFVTKLNAAGNQRLYSTYLAVVYCESSLL